MKFLYALLPLGLASAAVTSQPMSARGDVPVKPEYPVYKRQSDLTDTVTSTLEKLLSDVKGQTKLMNDTLDGIDDDSDVLSKADAASQVWDSINEILSLIDGATEGFLNLNKSSGDNSTGGLPIIGDGDASELISGLLGDLFGELNGSLNKVINKLGLGALLGFINPLGTALSRLIDALKNLVDELLTLLKQILDGVLTGLSDALKKVEFGF